MTPPFIIFSSSRCGSTTLGRSLNLSPESRVADQPAFDDVPLLKSEVCERVKRVLSECSGFKHVFDPTGYPFLDVHEATIEEMERDGALWMELNTALLNYPDLRIIFLRRRNEFDRIVSELISRAIYFWAFAQPEVWPDEPDLYQQMVSQFVLPPLDEELVRWHVDNMPGIQNRLRSAIRTNAVMDVWYEDFFGEDVQLAERLERFADILKFLQISPSKDAFDSTDLLMLLRPSAKLNISSIFDRIPNYRELQKNVTITRGASDYNPPWLDAPGAGPSPNHVGQRRRAEATRPISLRTDHGNVAGFSFLPGEPPGVRVVIARTGSSVSFDVQLNVSIPRLESERSYTISFRARADQPRSVFVGVAQAHDPWLNLGWYREVRLSDEWQYFQVEFTATATDDQARVHYDLGGSAIAVELADLSLRQQRNGGESLIVSARQSFVS